MSLAPSTRRKNILLVNDNLFFTGRISGDLERRGYSVRVVSGGDELDGAALSGLDGAVVNLGLKRGDAFALIAKIKGAKVARVVGFCGHKESLLIERGSAAGCDQVIPNSALDSLAVLLNV